jgi:hypothetical protein
MNVQSKTSEVKNLIIQAQTKEALEKLLSIIEENKDFKRFEKSIISLEGRYNQVESDMTRGLSKLEDYRFSLNLLNNSIIEVLDSIDQHAEYLKELEEQRRIENERIEEERRLERERNMKQELEELKRIKEDQEQEKIQKQQVQLLEEQIWQGACQNNSIESYQVYLERFPTGKHFVQANEKIRQLKALLSEIQPGIWDINSKMGTELMAMMGGAARQIYQLNPDNSYFGKTGINIMGMAMELNMSGRWSYDYETKTLIMNGTAQVGSMSDGSLFGQLAYGSMQMPAQAMNLVLKILEGSNGHYKAVDQENNIIMIQRIK